MSSFPQDVYARNLLSHRGYPLWTPEPSIELPESYQREGLKIGDVGVVVPEDGSFDVFFNITLPREHPLHAPDGVPDNFSQVELRREDYRIVPDAECPGRVISSSSVECTVSCVDPFDLDGKARSLTDHQFSLCRNEGAMLILPEGAERHRLAKELLLLDVVVQNAVDWYRFARERLYRNIRNDALYLVTGFHKACSWSLASFQNTGASSARCKLVQSTNGGPILPTHSTWETVRPLEWRIGPRHSVGTPNQSVFITGFRIAVNVELLHLKRVTVKVDHSKRTLASRLVGFGAGFANVIVGGTSGEVHPLEAATQDEGSGQSTMEHDEHADEHEDVTVECVPHVSQPFHPSDIINHYLLRKEPSAKIAVTHDSQWIALLENGILTKEELVQEGRLEAVVSREYHVVTKDGAVYLDIAPETSLSNNNNRAIFAEAQDVRFNPDFTDAVGPSSTRTDAAASQVTQLPSTTVQATTSVPASTPATSSPSAPPPPSGPSIPSFSTEVLDQVVAQTGLEFSQMMERLKVLEGDVPILDAKIADAQNTGQTAVLAALQQERTTKAHIKEQIKMLLRQHYHKMLLAKETPSAQASAAGSAVPNASADVDEDVIVVPPPHVVLARFWPRRAGTISAPNGSSPQAGPDQMQIHPTLAPEVAAQMQKLLEKKGVRPPSFGPPSQTPGTMSHETGVTSNATNVLVEQAFNTSSWLGTFSVTFPKLSGQVTTEVQIHVAGAFTIPTPTEIRTEIRTDLWPKNFTLNPCKEPVKENAELSSWLKRHQPRTRVMQFKPNQNPRTPDRRMNELRFQALNKFMTERLIFAYAGWQLPSGKFSYNIFIFPMGSSFAGVVFPDGLPDLPGSGSALDVQPPVGEVKPQQPLSGLTFPPALGAYMRGLEPAERKQRAHTASGQGLSPLGVPITRNPSSAMANIPAGLQANVNAPTNARAYNVGVGTVNYEMVQSFMQGNADESTSQGMNSGSMP